MYSMHIFICNYLNIYINVILMLFKYLNVFHKMYAHFNFRIEYQKRRNYVPILLPLLAHSTLR